MASTKPWFKTSTTIAAILMMAVPTSMGGPVDEILGSVVTNFNDFCDDDEQGVGAENYSCPITCAQSDWVTGVIQTNEEVPVIWVNADCGTGDSSDYCQDDDYCLTDAQTKVAGAGTCSGYSRTGNFNHHSGTLLCVSDDKQYGGSSGFAASDSDALDDLQALASEDLSCDVVEQDASEGVAELNSAALVWFDVNQFGLAETRGVSLESGECEEYQPTIVWTGDGFFIF